MVDIRAFKGTLYNPENIDNLAKVTAPPYDIISPAQRENYEKKHEHNIVRLILSQDRDNDIPTNNKYTRATDLLNDWLNKDVLRIDSEEALYIYEQRFEAKERTFQRVGFICRVKIEDFSTGVILPHEKTYAGAKTDRHNLLRAAKTNFSQIFSLFQDEENKVDQVLDTTREEPPAFDIVDEDNIRHKIWRMTDPARIEKIRETLKNKQIFIADGHHRYESSLNYRDEMRGKNSGHNGEEPYNFTMMMMVSMSNPGLIILPTHRMLKGVKDFTTEKFIETVRPYFEVEVIGFTPENKLEKLAAIEEKIEEMHHHDHVFCLYTAKEFIFLKLKDIAPVLEQVAEPRTDEWKKLDVTILHHFILKNLMNYVPETGQVKYTPFAKLLVEKVDNQDFEMGFILAPTKIEEVRNIAALHEIMPQKSTYFYPKLLTGLVINKH